MLIIIIIIIIIIISDADLDIQKGLANIHKDTKETLFYFLFSFNYK